MWFYINDIGSAGAFVCVFLCIPRNIHTLLSKKKRQKPRQGLFLGYITSLKSVTIRFQLANFVYMFCDRIAILRARSFGIFRNKNIFRNLFQLFCSLEKNRRNRNPGIPE